MGLNVNKGEKICLRIRTDDLQGFRKYLSIRDVLFHELTHQLHSEHDAAFWNCMSELKKEADKLDWTKSKGHRVGGRQTLEYNQDKLRRQLERENGNEGHDEDNYGVTAYTLVPDKTHLYEGGSAKLGGDDLLGDEDRVLSPRSRRRQQALMAIALRKSRAQKFQPKSELVGSATSQSGGATHDRSSASLESLTAGGSEEQRKFEEGGDANDVDVAGDGNSDSNSAGV